MLLLKYPTWYHVAINNHFGINLDNPADWWVANRITFFANINKVSFFVSLK